MIEAQESITGTISGPIAVNSVVNNGIVIPEENDPTVPSHVKAITEEDITRWNEGAEVDTSNFYTKEDIDNKGYITEEQVDNKGFITSVPEETDPTVPEYVKNITEEQISNWDKGGNTDLTNYYTKDEIDNKGYTTEEDIATYVEANKETLRGPQGPQGPKGDKADTPDFEKEKNGTTLTINDGKKVKLFEIDGNSHQEGTPTPDTPQEVEVVESVDVKVTNGLESTDSGYQEEIVTIDLQGNFLAKIGDIKDELDVVTGKLTKRIGKVVLDGSESWTQAGTQFNGLYSAYIFLTPMKKTSVFDDILSSHFKSQDFWVQEEGITKSAEPLNYDYVLLRLSNTKATTINELKTWLASNNVEVYYILAEPYEVQLTPSTIPMEEGEVNHYSITNPLIENLYCKYYTPYRGDDGVTPVKGVDYFTEADKQELINSMPSGGGGGNIATIEPEVGEEYSYFYPNVVSKGLVSGVYYLTHPLRLATSDVENTSGEPNPSTLFPANTLVEISEGDSFYGGKYYYITSSNNQRYYILIENEVIKETATEECIYDIRFSDNLANYYRKDEIDEMFNSIVNGNEVSY